VTIAHAFPVAEMHFLLYVTDASSPKPNDIAESDFVVLYSRMTWLNELNSIGYER
jgi:hypothetical protein